MPASSSRRSRMSNSRREGGEDHHNRGQHAPETEGNLLPAEASAEGVETRLTDIGPTTARGGDPALLRSVPDRPTGWIGRADRKQRASVAIDREVPSPI